MYNLYDSIRESCVKYADSPAFSIKQGDGQCRAYTYGQVAVKVEEYSIKLANAGMRKGDRIVLAAENSPEWAIAFLSIISSGCTAVLVDSSLSGFETDELIERSDPRGIMISPETMRKLSGFKSIESAGLPAFNILDGAAPFAGATAVLAEGHPPTPDPDADVMAILYSSGTTSTSKGVMHTHAGTKIMVDNNIANNRVCHGERFLCVVPLYHIMGFMCMFTVPIHCGVHVRFLESLNAESLVREFLEFKPTGFVCVPRIFDIFGKKIIDTVQSKGRATAVIFDALIGLSLFIRKSTGLNIGRVLFKRVHETFGGCVRRFLTGGASIDPGTSRLFFGLGFYLLNNYGVTETNIPITTNNFTHYTLNTGGMPFTGVSLKINDPDENGTGEIFVKSPGMMKGYFRDPETTESAFAGDTVNTENTGDTGNTENGWFRTGDTGYLDRHGDLNITGRTKENIILASGKKITPGDLECRFKSAAGISEFVICGIPRKDGLFDEIHAFIVKDKSCGIDDGILKAEITGISSSLPPHMRISRINILDEIPKTSLQKPKRYLLKEMVLAAEAAGYEAACAEDAANTAIMKNSNLDYKAVLESANKFNYTGIIIDKGSRLFEDIGFDSLTASEFCMQLEAKTGRNMASCLKPGITVGEIAGLLEMDEGSARKTKDCTSGFPMKRGFLASFLFTCFKAMSKLIYKMEVHGISNIPGKGGFIICPNHQTHLDALFILSHLPGGCYKRFCCMAKIEHLGNPVGRAMLRIGGGIPVDRYNNPAPAYERCLQKLREEWVVLIHPEGTRTKDGNMGEFKKGASRLSIDSGVPIIPVRIRGGFEIYPKGRLLPKLFDIRRFRRYRLIVSFGKPLHPEEADTENLVLILRDKIIEL